MTVIEEQQKVEAQEPMDVAGHRPRRLGQLNLQHVLLALAALVVAYLALVPVVTMIYASLRSAFLSSGPSTWTFQNFSRMFEGHGFATLVGNSFVYAAATAVLSTTIGFAFAWLVMRTNTPAKVFAGAVVLVPLIIPGILNAAAFSLLLAPGVGPVNRLLANIGLPQFNLYSLHGMIFVQSTHATPLAFLLGVAALTSMDSSLEEAAAISGASNFKVFRAISLRLVRPAVLSAFLLIFVQTIGSFEVPELIGVPGHKFVFVSQIFGALQTFPQDYGGVGSIGTLVLVVAVVGLIISRRFTQASATQTISGKGFRSTANDIGRWRWAGFVCLFSFFVIVVVLPIAMLLWSSVLSTYRQPSLDALHHLSLVNYRNVVKSKDLIKSLQNSIIVALSTGIITTLLSSVVSYIIVRTRMKGRVILDLLATAPIAVPSIILGVGLLFWYLVAPLPFQLYGTLTILVIAFVTISLPYSMRYMVPGMQQISDELEEAATVSGASWIQRFRRVIFPLLMPSLVASFIYTMILAFREISAAAFLYTSETKLVSVSIFTYYADGAYSTVAALGICMVAILSILVAIVYALGRRLGISAS